MIALVIAEPIGGFQDFRYVPLLLIPVLFYIFQGIRLLAPRLREWALRLLMLHVLFSGILLYFIIAP
jgi:hypothetical protein